MLKTKLPNQSSTQTETLVLDSIPNIQKQLEQAQSSALSTQGKQFKQFISKQNPQNKNTSLGTSIGETYKKNLELKDENAALRAQIYELLIHKETSVISKEQFDQLGAYIMGLEKEMEDCYTLLGRVAQELTDKEEQSKKLAKQNKQLADELLKTQNFMQSKQKKLENEIAISKQEHKDLRDEIHRTNSNH